MDNISKNDIIIVTESQFGFIETLAKITQSIEECGWKIIVSHNLQDILLKHGTSIAPIHVLELCNPRFASQLLSIDSLLMYSPFMPCRISVYENAHGQCFISRMNVGALLSQVGGVAYEIMCSASEEMEEIIGRVSKKRIVL
ncbi:MAG: DUF302 domain-containing protein [Bacteroidales bacterium]